MGAHARSGLLAIPEHSLTGVMATVGDLGQAHPGSEHHHDDIASYQIFPHQVAGHGHIRIYSPHQVMKPAIPREVAFYRIVEDLPLSAFTPVYAGVLDAVDVPCRNCDADEQPEIGKYIILQNLTAGLSRPCILDLKMGIRHYGLHASPEKIARATLKSEQSTSRKCGFRVCGMKSFHWRTGAYVRLDKKDARVLNESQLPCAFKHFLSDGAETRYHIIRQFINSLEELRSAVQQLASYRFYSSSLLLVYDGERDSVPRPRLHVIDFAKTYKLDPNSCPDWAAPDEDFLLGLTSIQNVLKGIL
eukprot:c16191_g1_i2.p1 GENE.c16191_g1_i2~~c16191_g1_i2.p1  ORF type:complete len:303 (-),score=41.70 c16191_g1_i2:706-1614(-)